MNNTAKVILWGSLIGAVTWVDEREIGVFQYAPDFLRSNIQIAPMTMPLSEYPYEFPALPRNTFRGLPGLLADSLPDRFGNTIIDAWLASQGRTADSFNSVERLCYVGVRGIGALEFQPAILDPPSEDNNVNITKLVELASKILTQRESFKGILSEEDDREAIENILRIGTSAGGARAKAVLAWNPTTNEFRSGQLELQEGFEHWLMKFDGVRNNRDKELADPMGYGKIEYAYHLMALDAGITMTQCRLHNEGGRSHFMTRRFDRTQSGYKLHMQSLGAIAHFDFNSAGSYSYEQAIQVMKRLNLFRGDLEQQVLRAIFNIVGRNQDDHVKNIAFLMNRSGTWQLSPAFDLTYAWNPDGDWTSRHQMSINNKRKNISRGDLLALASIAGIKKRQGIEMIDSVLATFRQWKSFAEKASVSEERAHQIEKALRLDI
jgi:serine/threonine-protein kinase HipA